MLIPSWRLIAGWGFRHFSPHELSCKCGGTYCRGEVFYDPDFMAALENMRDAYGGPIRVTSGHRCRLHNARIGGAPRSMHKTIAVDLADPREQSHREALYRAARVAGFTGFGFYRGWLHVDRGAPRHWTIPNQTEVRGLWIPQR